MISNTISRDAGDKSKGFRLQKLRALLLLLAATEKSDSALVLCALEVAGDVTLLGKTMAIEENKNYSTDASFSFNSHQVINTTVMFLDTWFRYDMSENVYFSFYSTSGIAKENTTSRSQSLSIAFPSEPILQTLSTSRAIDDSLIAIISKLIMAEYKLQYAAKTGTGNLAAVEQLTQQQWRDFLKLIHWQFGMPDHQALEKEVIAKIKASRHFSSLLLGREDYVKAYLLDLFDKKQCEADYLDRFIHSAEIRNTFLDVQGHRARLPKGTEDPVYKLWQAEPAPDDKRSIKQKLQDVCASLEVSHVNTYVRKAALGRAELNDLQTNKDFQSLRYRIFVRCGELVTSGAVAGQGDPTPDMIKTWFEHLSDECATLIQSLSKDYRYHHHGPEIIKGIIYELFDSCYLAFDKSDDQ